MSGICNYAAVYVSWFDAMAFCRWLSHRLGLVVRLPDEWEWSRQPPVATPATSIPGHRLGAET